MKRPVAGVISILAFGACADQSPVGPGTVTITTIALDLVPSTVSASVGQTVQFVAVVTGSTNQAATYTSSNTLIASVSSTGVANCLAEGIAVITATSSADPTARDASVLTCSGN